MEKKERNSKIMITIFYLNTAKKSVEHSMPIAFSVILHFGEELPNIFTEDVFELVADGDELDVLLNGFSGIPLRKNARVKIWRGDTARFIFEHIQDLFHTL